MASGTGVVQSEGVEGMRPGEGVCVVLGQFLVGACLNRLGLSHRLFLLYRCLPSYTAWRRPSSGCLLKKRRRRVRCLLLISVFIHPSGLHKGNYIPLNSGAGWLGCGMRRQGLLQCSQCPTGVHLPVVDRVTYIVQHAACKYPLHGSQKIFLRTNR